MKRHIRGFTLVELLLALAISAIIAIGTLQLFNTSVTTRNTLSVQAEEQSQLTRALRVIETDIIQFAPLRPVRDAFGDYQLPMVLNFEGLFFTRSGWAVSPFMAYERSIQQRVHYRVAEPGSELCVVRKTNNDNEQGGCLIRSYLAHLDDDGSLQWFHQNLLQQVESLEWRFLVYDPQTNSSDYQSFPPEKDPRTDQQLSRLRAVEITLELSTGAEHKRLFMVPVLPAENTEVNS